MCGIAGIICSNPNEVSLTRLKKMTDVIAHRGPDGDGHWISPNGKVGFGHRRLSIIDLHTHASQPMHYLERYTIVFNGEIYNYIELKDQLIKQGYPFRTSSDTEVLMAMYDRHKEDCLQYLDGMFSFVIYDERENSIFCARDRFGEKPFFYAHRPGEYFIFGSEMKELWAAGIKKEVNERMLYRYLAAGKLENEDDLSETFYQNCYRLPHGHYIKCSINELQLQFKQYYDIDWENINENPDQKETEERFKELFYKSVNLRLRSDVPVGSSLSGGLDSSLVVTVIDELKKQTGNTNPQKTFSAIFPGFAKDESKYMKMVIDKTNVEPHFVTPDDNGLINDLDKLFYHQEEPFASASIYVQYCVMQLAGQNNVTVLLDGQGADEILAGYHGYYSIYFNELKNGRNNAFREEFDLYQELHKANDINNLWNDSLKHRLNIKFRKKFPSSFNAIKSLYSLTGSRNKYLNPDFLYTHYKADKSHPIPQTLNEALYYSLFVNGLQDLLRYADRNSMAHSREVRLPFLSHHIVDFLFSLPANFKIRSGWTKWIMRQTFNRELPEQITWRKDKIGYEPPQENWMKTNIIREKIRSGQESLVNRGILNKKMLDTVNSTFSQDVMWKQLMASELIS